MKMRFSEEQIIGFLREAEAGLPIKELCRRYGSSEASYYLWRSKFGGMSVSDAKRLKELEIENSRLKKMLAESMLEIEITSEALRKSGKRTVTSSATRPARERQCVALKTGSQAKPARAHRGPGSPALPLRCRHDLSEAASDL